jgi:hypothetical protein
MQNINFFIRYIQTTEYATNQQFIETSAPVSIIDCYRFGVLPINVWRNIPKYNITIIESKNNIIPIRTYEINTHPLSFELIDMYINKQIPNDKVIIMQTPQIEFTSTPNPHEHIKCYTCGKTKFEEIFSYPEKISTELQTCFMKQEFCSNQCLHEYLHTRNMHNQLLNFHLMNKKYSNFKRIYDTTTYYMFISMTNPEFETLNPITDKILIKT